MIRSKATSIILGALLLIVVGCSDCSQVAEQNKEQKELIDSLHHEVEIWRFQAIKANEKAVALDTANHTYLKDDISYEVIPDEEE